MTTLLKKWAMVKRIWSDYKRIRPYWEHWYAALWTAIKYGRYPRVKFDEKGLKLWIKNLQEEYPVHWNCAQMLVQEMPWCTDPEGKAITIFLENIRLLQISKMEQHSDDTLV